MPGNVIAMQNDYEVVSTHNAFSVLQKINEVEDDFQHLSIHPSDMHNDKLCSDMHILSSDVIFPSPNSPLNQQHISSESLQASPCFSLSLPNHIFDDLLKSVSSANPSMHQPSQSLIQTPLPKERKVNLRKPQVAPQLT